MALVAVSHESIWIDEGFSAHFAVQPDFAGWWRTLKAGGPPDVQMPLYMYLLWAWEKIFGSSEWALRAANIPWFLVAQAAYWVGLRRWPRLRLAAVLCGACDPFLWRYLNEARPYAMHYSGAAIVVSCLAWLAGEPEPVLSACWLSAFGGGLFVLCASNALGVPWAGGAVLALFCLGWRKARIASSPASALVSAAWVVALGALAAYFAWTPRGGVTGFTGAGHRLGGLCFAAYELLGFVGLGPSRISVTTAPDPKLFFPFLGILAPFAILFAGMLAIAARALIKQQNFPRLLAAAVCYLLLPLSFLLGIVFMKGWQPAARHFAPASPVIVLATALAVAAAWREKSRWQIGWTAAFLLLWFVSSLEIRFAMRHRRDDYRDAARAALTAMAQGKRVWWAAAGNAGQYYHLRLTENPKDPTGAFQVWHPGWSDIANLPEPDEVFLSKPQLFDPAGNLTAYLQLHHYRFAGNLPAFSIWEK